MRKIQVLLVLGAQWGDEGKGKIVDFLSKYFDYAVRFQGGPNAGHTVVFDDKKIVLHTIPSGILRENCCAVMSNGVLVDIDVLEKEFKSLKDLGVDFKGRLFISNLCHIILPIHKKLDALLDTNKKIGTTKMGIGPAVEFKVARHGIRIKDIFSQEIKSLLKENIEYAQKLIKSFNYTDYDSDINLEEIYSKLMKFAEKIHDFVTDTQKLLRKKIEEGKKILLEGAQGILLDIDFGTYPFVTSTNTSPGGSICGTGINPKSIDAILGVVKAYTTRVGGGPFPSEIKDENEAQTLRELGGEYGSTTGRPRRVGWLDIPLLKYSKNIAYFDFLALTKTDVLEKLGKSFYIEKYLHKDIKIDEPDTTIDISQVVPILCEVKRASEIKNIIENELGLKVVINSFGPDRSKIEIDENFLSLIQ